MNQAKVQRKGKSSLNNIVETVSGAIFCRARERVVHHMHTFRCEGVLRIDRSEVCKNCVN